MKYIGLNENENTTYQNLEDAVKAVVRADWIAVNVCVRKEERPKIGHLSFHLRKLKKRRAN